MASIQEAQEEQFEVEVARNPYNIKAWLNLLAVKKEAQPTKRYLVYERAVTFLPRSYKLWHAYLQERTSALTSVCVTDRRFTILVQCYERALVNLYKMPRIWLDYTAILVRMQKGTAARKAFDRALQALPITQHQALWKEYVAWAKSFGVADTCVRVYRRYLMYDPSHREDFVAYLVDIEEFEEAARQLAVCLNDEHYVSPSGQTHHQMWMQLCDICAMHPEAVSRSLKVEAIIRSGISRFSDEVGRLWCRLADYFVRLGQFDKARDVYEEALNTVSTVRDFSVVFDSYVKVEESVVTAKMRLLDEEAAAPPPSSSSSSSGSRSGKTSGTSAAGGGEDDDAEGEAADLEMRLARLEYLMDKRPVMLSSVLLRQNRHNVVEWHKRAKLFKNDPNRALLTYIEGVKTVDPKLATGKLSGLWLALARFYENHGDPDNARSILAKATEVDFRSVDELATVWCAWGEMEIRHEQYAEALAVMQRAVTEPAASAKRRKAAAVAQGKGQNESGGTVADRLYKNVKVWGLYLDLEESLGTVDTCRAAYDRVMDLKIITPQMVLNYATYLEERDFFEDSFRVYERAVVLFAFPEVKRIWLEYLDKFMGRYGGSKLERLRDLFEQAVAKVPTDDVAEFYVKYAKAEETFGLARHAMAVYDRATRLVPEANRLDMYRLYIKKVEVNFGVTKTRPVYERAVTELNEGQSKAICVEFAEMERKLGEIDRARAILQHGAQYADPRQDPSYWRRWREFEEAHGNEDTFRDMLRVQRSVETAYSQVNYLAAEMVAGDTINMTMDIEAMAQLAEHDAMLRATNPVALGAENVGQKRKFVAASSSSSGDPHSKAQAVSAARGSEEIDIDDDDEGEAEEPATKPVPLAVFGSAAAAAAEQ
jgi:pre-mRNA-splicing factor SYF1